MRVSFLLLLVLLLFNSCSNKNDYQVVFSDPLLYSKTVYALNGIVMGNNFSPMVASRNYLYANIAAYEIIVAGNPTQYQSLYGQVKDLPTIPLPPPNETINYNFAALLAFCKLGEAVTFPSGSMTDVVEGYKQMARKHGMPKEIYENSISYMETVSSVILEWSKKDYYAETRSSPKYTVYDSPGRWVPTPPAYSSAAEPHWNLIRPLVIDSISQFLPKSPFNFDIKDSTSKYYKEVMKIKSVGDSLTPEMAAVADFWDDNPFKLNVSGHVMFATKKFSPGGHWMSVVGIASQNADADFQTTVCAYTKTAIAIFDAFIQTFNIKYLYNTVRPETVINKYFDENWRPHLQTPPFPEYTCGHCYISATAAESLTSMFGDHFSYTDSSESDFGLPARKFSSFRSAAEETAKSRFYGGIHYEYSTIVSHEMGQKIGKHIVSRLRMKMGQTNDVID